MARPQNDPPTRLMQFRCPEPMAEWIEEQARLRGFTTSELMRRLIERAGYETPPPPPRRKK